MNLCLIIIFQKVFKIQMQNEQQMNQIKKGEPQIGTEILDSNLPSNLDFDENPNKQKQKQLEQINDNISMGIQKIDTGSSLKSFTIKGKIIFNMEPSHKINSVITEILTTFSVKCFDDEKSQGFKKVWQTLVGYVNRQMYIIQGFIYLLENSKDGMIVRGILKMVDIFKLFVDSEENHLRIVFRQSKSEKLILKNYQSQALKEIFSRISEQLNSLGLVLVE